MRVDIGKIISQFQTAYEESQRNPAVLESARDYYRHGAALNLAVIQEGNTLVSNKRHALEWHIEGLFKDNTGDKPAEFFAGKVEMMNEILMMKEVAATFSSENEFINAITGNISENSE